MHHLLTLALSSALVLQAAPLMAAPGAAASRTGVQSSAATGTITGSVQSTAGQRLPNYQVQVRDLQTGKVTATGTSNGEGNFAFAGLPLAGYAIEVGSGSGAIVGVNTARPTAANGSVRTTVAIVAAPAAPAVTPAGSPTTAAVVARAASAARIGAVASPSGRPNASPSR